MTEHNLIPQIAMLAPSLRTSVAVCKGQHGKNPIRCISRLMFQGETADQPYLRQRCGAHLESSFNFGDLIVPEAIIEAREVEKSLRAAPWRKVQVIAPTDLAVYPGTIFALLGPSGSGKSTLLRMLTGLSQPSSGQVLWHGLPLDGQVPNVAIVFQSFALYPWLTVLENVEAPLEARCFLLDASQASP